MNAVLRRLEELERRQSQMIVRGKIAKVDPEKALARVQYGPELITGWLTWKPPRTGNAIVWLVPEIGEGVTVISNGDLSLGEILPGSYHAGFKAPSNDPDLYHVNFGNGTTVEYHRTENRLTVNVVGDVQIGVSGDVALTTGGQAKVSIGSDAAVTVAGNAELTTEGDVAVKADGNAEVTTAGDASITADGDAEIVAGTVKLNADAQAAGVVTGLHKCLVLGIPHADCSTKVISG